MRITPALFVLVALAALSSPAAAQGIPLPRLDSINFFVQAGDFEGRDAVDAQTYGPFGTYGWGFETAFTVVARDSHVVELAVGYDQLFQHAKIGTFTLNGEVRDLPSLSVYVSFQNDLYVGLATGIVSLANATIDDGTSRFSLGGDTFDLAAKVGYAIPLQSDSTLVNRRVNGFIEADYHARYFGGITYSPGAPTDLPARMYLGGFTVAAGVQISLDAARDKAGGDKPAESKPVQIDDKPIGMKTKH